MGLSVSTTVPGSFKFFLLYILPLIAGYVYAVQRTMPKMVFSELFGPRVLGHVLYCRTFGSSVFCDDQKLTGLCPASLIPEAESLACCCFCLLLCETQFGMGAREPGGDMKAL